MAPTLRDALVRAEQHGGVVQLTGPAGAGIDDPEDLDLDRLLARVRATREAATRLAVERIVKARTIAALDNPLVPNALAYMGRLDATNPEHAFRVGNAARARFTELVDAMGGRR